MRSHHRGRINEDRRPVSDGLTPSMRAAFGSIPPCSLAGLGPLMSVSVGFFSYWLFLMTVSPSCTQVQRDFQMHDHASCPAEAEGLHVAYIRLVPRSPLPYCPCLWFHSPSNLLSLSIIVPRLRRLSLLRFRSEPLCVTGSVWHKIALF